MNKLTFVTGICIIGVCASGCAETENPPSQTEQVEWGYEEENGPDVWGQLSPDFALCAEGTLQSPIDLVAPAASELSDIMFDYQPSEMNIHNNGHTIEVSPASENRIEVDGVGYQLLQFHFHAPSEHTVAGRTFEMEMHLVHRNEAGTLTVIGVLVEPGDETLPLIPCGRNCRTRPAPRISSKTPLSTPTIYFRAIGAPTATTVR